MRSTPITVFPSGLLAVAYVIVARHRLESTRVPLPRKISRPGVPHATYALFMFFILCVAPMASQAVANDQTERQNQLNGVGSHPIIRHFNLLGPDWARIPKGYSGLTPMKVVAELNIPEQYVVLGGALRGPLTENESSIPIVVFYPSMKGASRRNSSEARINVIISAGTEEGFRNGARSLIFVDGRTRDPSLDVNGLCGYVDHVHRGWAGVEFYTSCNKSEQTFSIICHPPLNGIRSCMDGNFVGEQFGAQLFYQYSMLKEHRQILDSLKTLILSFAQPAGR